MLIEQINEFGLKGLGPLVVLVLLQLVIFVKNKKSLRKIFQWIMIYCLNSAGAMYLPSLYLGQITKFNLKTQGFKRVLDLNCK